MICEAIEVLHVSRSSVVCRAPSKPSVAITWDVLRAAARQSEKDLREVCGARCDLRKAVVEVVVRVDGVEVQKLEQHVDRWAVPHVVQAAIVQVEDPDYDGARDAGLAPGVRT